MEFFPFCFGVKFIKDASYGPECSARRKLSEQSLCSSVEHLSKGCEYFIYFSICSLGEEEEWAAERTMATLSLKISVVGSSVVKTFQFDPSTIVFDACRIIRDKIPEANTGNGKTCDL